MTTMTREQAYQKVFDTERAMLERVAKERDMTFEEARAFPIGNFSARLLDYIDSTKLKHYTNSRVVATISGQPIMTVEALSGNIFAGNHTLLTGNASTGKSQFMFDAINQIIGEQNSLLLQQELLGNDPKALFSYIDRNVYVETGRTDSAVQMKNLEKPLLGIEEITRGGPLQNSLFGMVDGDVYDPVGGNVHKLGRTLSRGGKLHIAIATGNLANGHSTFAYAGKVDGALATRFHLFLDVDDVSRTVADDITIRLQRRGPKVAVSEPQSLEEQERRLQEFLKAHEEITSRNAEHDPIESIILGFFSQGLDHCVVNRGGPYALVPHSKRAMKNQWPDMCSSCPLYSSLKWTCGALMPTEPRHENAWVRARNSLEAIAEAKGRKQRREEAVEALLSGKGNIEDILSQQTVSFADKISRYCLN